MWLHQLLCNVSNQARSREEDKLNHPWRPLPSGRLSESEAVALRWAIVAGCVTLSSMLDQDLVRTTLCLVAFTYTYDELGGASNVVGKAFCTAGGYISFELGATAIVGTSRRYYVLKQPSVLSFRIVSTNRQLTGVLDFVSVTSVIISGVLIFTAIQAQDFSDVEGDKAVGRMTFPIYAPELSRFVTLFATSAWSVFLCWFWEVGPFSTALITSFGLHVGLRYYCWRTIEADKKSYLIFNVRFLSRLPRLAHPETSFLTYGRPRFGSWPLMFFLYTPERPFWRSDDDLSRLTAHLRHILLRHILCIRDSSARPAHDCIFIMDRSVFPYMYTFHIIHRSTFYCDICTIHNFY